MKPIGYLMIEHRLIERMVALIKRRSEEIINHNELDVAFIENAIDFYTTYADKCHHGKEEDILFTQLQKRSLSPPHRALLEDLLADHQIGRTLIRSLAEAKNRYPDNKDKTKADIALMLARIVDLYTAHIEKEDKTFFPVSMEYLSREEQDAMLRKFEEFDRDMIHSHYRTMMEALEEPEQNHGGKTG